MKQCPFCAEQIQDEAIVCKHCGRELDVEAVKQVDRSLGQGAVSGPVPEEIEPTQPAEVEPAIGHRDSENGRTGVIGPIMVGLAIGAVLTVLVYSGDLVNLGQLSEETLTGGAIPLAFRASLQDLVFHFVVTLIWVTGAVASIAYGIRLRRNQEPVAKAFILLFVFLLLEVIPVGGLVFGLWNPLVTPFGLQADQTGETTSADVADPTVVSSPTTRSLPHATPTVPGVTYLDTFDPSTTRFPSGSAATGWQFDVTESGHYRVVWPRGSSVYAYQLAGWNIADGSLTLSAWPNQNNSIGAGHAVVFRWVDNDNHYALFLESWGMDKLRVLVQKRMNGEWADLGWCYYPAHYFNLGCQVYLTDQKTVPDSRVIVQLDMQGEEMSVNLNGDSLLRFTDSSFRGGDVGLGAIADTTGGVEVFFDDLEFRDSD